MLWAQAITDRLHAQIASRAGGAGSEQIARDESFWASVRGRFALQGDVVNLDHGWCNPAPRSKR